MLHLCPEELVTCPKPGREVGGSRELWLVGLSPALQSSRGLGLRRDFWF